MRFPVFLDTNVLYPASLADTLLRLAELDVIKPHWSSEVMTELERNLAKRIPEEKAHLRCRAMQNSFPEAMVADHQGIIDKMGNHPKDRHVLAAAVHSQCEVIITFNTKDFPEDALNPLNMEAVHPDNFLLDQLDLYPQLVLLCLERQTHATARPHLSLPELIDHFDRIQLRGFAAALKLQIADYL